MGEHVISLDGQSVATTSINGTALASATGTALNCATAMSRCSMVARATSGTITTGTVTLTGSLDGATYASTGITIDCSGLTGTAAKTGSWSGGPFLLYRAEWAGGTGTYTLTVKLMSCP